MKFFHLYTTIFLQSIFVHTNNTPEKRILSSKRVIGGRIAKIYNFPFTASLILRSVESDVFRGLVDDFRGGAVIIHEYWAVTAAHCMAYIPASDIKKGLAFVRSNSAYWQTLYIDHKIVKTYIHEEYNASITDNDIAVLKVKQPFNGPNEKPIRIPDTNYKYVDHSISIILGWGTTDPEASEPFVVSHLRYAKVNLINYNQCKSKYRKVEEIITPQMICAGSPGKDACVYDSGGPLYQNNFLIGLVSWGGQTCADDQLPGVYTKVAVFRSWIDEIISQH